MKWKCIAAIMLVFSSSAMASGPQLHRNMSVIGMGLNSCGDYLSARAGQQGPNEATIYNQWVDGFVVGLYASSGDPLPSDHAGIDGWIANYCALHPTDALVAAALQLSKEH